MEPDAVSTVPTVPHGSSEDSALLDFSANTNPETPEGTREVYKRAFDESRSYPPEPPEEFCTAAASYVGCPREQIVPTPGGLAAIRLAIELSVTAGNDVLVPAPSFGEYAREVRLQGGTPVFVDHGAILEHDPEGYSLAIVCNPNNPTGTAYDVDALRSFVERCRAVETTVLVDEAFLDFTARPSLAGTDGVIVARSLTKLFGLPGIRAGFAVTPGDVEGMRATTGDGEGAFAVARQPWNVSRPALSVGTYCLQQSEFVRRTRDRVESERTRMRNALENHYTVHPSAAPFLLLDVGNREPSRIVAAAREQGIAIRDATTFRGLDSHVRIAVRLPAENDRVIEVLRGV